mgnify:CR=1 FL=1
MGNVVKITGSKSGIILKLDPEAEWELIKKEVADKFRISGEMHRRRSLFRAGNWMMNSRMRF